MARAQRGEEYAARSDALKLHNCLLPMGEGRLFNRERDPAGPEREQPEWSREEADPGWDALDALSWRQHQFALRFYREHNADPGGDRSLPGLYNDYKEYDERMLRAIPNGVKRYLRDVAGANVGASANGSGN